jgi:hypothetical protein
MLPATSVRRQERARRRERRRRAGRLTRAAVVLGLEVAAGYAIVSAISLTPSAPADSPRALSVAAVAHAPASFRGRPVQLRGRIAERPERVSPRDRGAFVLSRGSDRLLVVPAKGARLTAFRVGTNVVVRGSVVLPPDSKRLARHPTSRTAIAKRVHAPAILKAVEVTFAP